MTDKLSKQLEFLIEADNYGRNHYDPCRNYRLLPEKARCIYRLFLWPHERNKPIDYLFR